MRGYVLLGGVAVLIAYFSVQPASFLEGSHLGLFENRIEDPMDVMTRVSPELRANFKRFDECMQKAGCKPEPFFAERDRIVAKLWPTVFDRLAVRSDWGTCISCAAAHDAFESARAKVGDYRLRYECVPDVSYSYDPARNAGREAAYNSAGYKCDGKNITYET